MTILAKHAGTALSTLGQLLTAKQPTERTSLTKFMKTIGEAKVNWFDIYSLIQTKNGLNKGANRPFYNYQDVDNKVIERITPFCR